MERKGGLLPCCTHPLPSSGNLAAPSDLQVILLFRENAFLYQPSVNLYLQLLLHCLCFTTEETEAQKGLWLEKKKKSPLETTAFIHMHQLQKPPWSKLHAAIGILLPKCVSDRCQQLPRAPFIFPDTFNALIACYQSHQLLSFGMMMQYETQPNPWLLNATDIRRTNYLVFSGYL